MIREFRVTALCLALAALPNAAALAQTRSQIAGTITDATGGALPGASVTVTSPSLVGGPQSSIAGSDGTYRIPELTPGVYELSVQLQGFQTIRHPDLRVLFGTTLTVDVALPIATFEQAVIVSGGSPVVDVTTTAATSTLDNSLLQNIPISNDKRLVANVIELAPGSYARSPYGAVRDTNALLLDGITVSEPQRNGIAGAGGIAYNWLDEVKFVALGANAEYGEFSGTAANFTLRSGGNQYSGLFDYWTAPGDWVGDNRGGLPPALQTLFRPLESLTNWDLTTQAGGPLVRDRLFFFAGFNYVHRKVSPFGVASPWDDHWPREVGKVNWAATSGIKVEGFVTVSSRETTGGTGGDPLRADRLPETAQTYENPAVIWSGRMTWASRGGTLLEIRQGGLRNTLDLNPTDPNTRTGPSPHQDQFTGITSINSPDFSNQRGTRDMVAGSLTRFVSGGFGRSHELKVGGEVERISNRVESGIPSGRLFLDFNGSPNQVTLFDGSTIEGTGTRAMVYAQDDWMLGNRITIQPGLRFAANRGSVPDKGTVFRTNPISPRIGVSWDVASDHKTVVRAHFGRFHDAFSTAFYEFMNTSGQSPRITASVVGPDNFVELTRFTPQGNLGVDSDIAQPSVDQLLVGVERQLFTQLSFQAQYIHRDSHGIAAFVDTRSRYEPVQRVDPGPDGLLNTADDAGSMTVYNLLNPGEAFRLLTNPEDAFRRYDGVQLVAQKRYQHNWQLQASYTYSRVEGNANNEFGEGAALGADTGQTGVFADPNKALNATGRLQYDFTHQFKAEGTYTVPVLGGINASAVFIGTSGVAIGRTAVIRGLAQGNVTVRIEPRGTRRTDGMKQLDLRVDKTIPLGRRRSASVYFDILNANNYGAPIIRFANPVIETSGPTFLTPRTWIDPRTVQVGVRFMF